MSGVNEALEAIRSLETTLNGYMEYDGMVGGLVSRSLRTLVEMRGLLETPTKANVQEALNKFQGIYDRVSPYAGEAPDVVGKANLVMEKLRAI